MSFDFDAWVAQHGMTIAPDDAECVWAWVDLETTGLDFDQDVILEFGMVITDQWGNVIADSAYHSLVWDHTDQYDARLRAAKADKIVGPMHAKSGLLDDLVRFPGSPKTAREVEREVLQLLKEFSLKPRDVYLAGGSVHFDAAMMNHYMFDLNQFMHYRQNNVSTLKVIASKVNPVLFASMSGTLRPFSAHRSMSDLGDSINEYKCYIENFLWV